MADLSLFAKQNDPAKIDEIRKTLSESTFVGVDFGTSTTTVTRLVFNVAERRIDSQPMQIAQETADGVWGRDHLVPTVIAKCRDRLLFGAGAKECLLDTAHYAEEINVWSCFKMHLGEQYCYPKSRLSSKNTTISGVVLETPKDATRLFFENLDRQVRETVRREGLPSNVRYAVTVPASFASNQREELCAAIKGAGIELDVRAFLDEPNSAFMGTMAYYGEQGQAEQVFNRGRAIKALIFDYGAGTCDISLLEVEQDLKMKNLALSRFTALGGRDIDMKIATDYLYPRLEESHDEKPTKDVRENILFALRATAERLKIAVCRQYAKGGGDPFSEAEDDQQVFVDNPFSAKTANFGIFADDAPQITSDAFAELMRKFSEDPKLAFENGNKTILDPVEDVLKKAKIEKDEIDFVVLVGGSSKNPFVKKILADYFGRFVEVLDPGDIQTLVARGAAIHSFAVNGLKQSFVKPITSEDIRIGTAGDRTVCVFPAGTSVPTGKKEINELYIGDEVLDEELFGIPFYASVSRGKPIGVALFDVENAKPGTPVLLRCGLNAAKVLGYQIEVTGRTFEGTFEMPLSTEETSPEMQRKIAAENALRRSMLENGGVGTVTAYCEAAEACMKAKKYDDAADHYWNLMYAHRSEHFEAELAEAYREAYRSEEELKWMRKAYDRNKNYINIWYLIWALERNNGWRDAELKDQLGEAMRRWPSDNDFKYIEICRLDACGDRVEADALRREICDEWEQQGVTSLGRYTLERFEEIARDLGRRDLARRIGNELTRRRSLEGEKIGDDSYTKVHSVNDDDLPARKEF